MPRFFATVKTVEGSEATIDICLERSAQGFSGELIWSGSHHQLRHVAPYPKGVAGQMNWLGVWTRTWIAAEEVGQEFVLSIRPLAPAFDYFITKDSYAEFTKFVEEVQRPNIPTVVDADFDSLLDEIDLRLVSVSLYQGSNIYKNIAVQFSECLVDDVPVSVAFPMPLPNDIGAYIQLGSFQKDSQINIKWTLAAWDVPPRAELAVGAFRDGRLSNRTVLAKYFLEPYKGYRGEALLTV